MRLFLDFQILQSNEALTANMVLSTREKYNLHRLIYPSQKPMKKHAYYFFKDKKTRTASSSDPIWANKHRHPALSHEAKWPQMRGQWRANNTLSTLHILPLLKNSFQPILQPVAPSPR